MKQLQAPSSPRPSIRIGATGRIMVKPRKQFNLKKWILLARIYAEKLLFALRWR